MLSVAPTCQDHILSFLADSENKSFDAPSKKPQVAMEKQ
jgi:hypothetical protein